MYNSKIDSGVYFTTGKNNFLDIVTNEKENTK